VEQNDEWGYITRSGDLAIEPQFERAYRFFEGRALVRENGTYGFIDTSGAYAVPPSYAAAGPFSGGIAPVRPDSLWGFIDRSGTMVIAPQFAMAAHDLVSDSNFTEMVPFPQRAEPPRFVLPEAVPSYFSENYARVRQDGSWGFLDRRGTLAIPPQFSAAGSFRNGLARVQFRSGDIGYVTPDGTRIWPPRE
jgi:hypothetical protein